MEELRYKVSLDTTDLQNFAQQTNLMTQQQVINTANQYQAATMGAGLPTGMDPVGLMAQQQAAATAFISGSSPYVGLDPRTVYAQQAFNTAVSGMGPPQNALQASMANFMGTPILSPTPPVGSGFDYPYQFIPGAPQFPEPTPRGVFRNAGIFGRQLLIGRMSEFLNQVTGLGFGGPGAGTPMDLPVYRQIQAMTEGLAEQTTDVGARIGEGLAGLGGVGATLGLAAMNPLLGGLAGLGVAGAYGMAQPFIQGPRDYMEISRYFRDATAPYIRSSRLGGGPSYAQREDFMQGFARQVAGDRFFTRDDFTSLMQTAGETGLLQVVNNPEQSLQILDNMSKNVKTLYAFGIKMKDTFQAIDQMTQLGVNVGGDPSRVANFMGRLGLAAFQSGQTVSSMMPGLVEAGQLFAQQGLAPQVGAGVHMQSQAIIGEVIRSGGFGIEDLAYFGGRQGLATSMTRTMATINRTPVGQLMTMSMMNNPAAAAQQIAGGGMTTGNLLSNMLGFSSPEQYMELQRMMPELTRDIDPTALGMGQAMSLMRMYQGALGGRKLTPGTLTHLLQQSGVQRRDAEATVRAIMGADQAQITGMQSFMNRARQLEVESMRGAFNPLDPRSYQNILERTFERPVANIGVGLQRMVEGIEHRLHDFYSEAVMGRNVVRLPRDVTGIDVLREEMMRGHLRSANQDNLEREMAYDTAANNLYRQNVNDPLIRSMENSLQNTRDKNINELNNSMRERNRGSRNNRRVSRSEINGIIGKMGKQKVTPQELQKVKDYIQSNHVSDNEAQEIVQNYSRALRDRPTNREIMEEVQTTDRTRGLFTQGMREGTMSEQMEMEFELMSTQRGEMQSILEEVVSAVGARDRTTSTSYSPFTGQRTDRMTEFRDPMSAINIVARRFGLDPNQLTEQQTIDLGAILQRGAQRFGTSEQRRVVDDLQTTMKTSVRSVGVQAFKDAQASLDFYKGKGGPFGLVRGLKLSMGMEDESFAGSLRALTNFDRLESGDEVNFAAISAMHNSVDRAISAISSSGFGVDQSAHRYLIDTLISSDMLPTDVRQQLLSASSPEEIKAALSMASDVLGQQRREMIGSDKVSMDFVKSINAGIRRSNKPGAIPLSVHMKSLRRVSEMRTDVLSSIEQVRNRGVDVMKERLNELTNVYNLGAVDLGRMKKGLETGKQFDILRGFKGLGDTGISGIVRDIGISAFTGDGLKDTEALEARVQKLLTDTVGKDEAAKFMRSTDAERKENILGFKDILEMDPGNERNKRLANWMLDMGNVFALSGMGAGGGAVVTQGGRRGYIDPTSLQAARQGMVDQQQALEMLTKMQDLLDNSLAIQIQRKFSQGEIGTFMRDVGTIARKAQLFTEGPH